MRNTGTRSNAAGSTISPRRSSATPLDTKKTGTKNPYPIASNLVRKFGCEAESRSIAPTSAPARKVPRMAVGLFAYNPYAASRCNHTSLTVGNDGTACRNISSGTAPAMATVAECSSS